MEIQAASGAFYHSDWAAKSRMAKDCQLGESVDCASTHGQRTSAKQPLSRAPLVAFSFIYTPILSIPFPIYFLKAEEN